MAVAIRMSWSAALVISMHAAAVAADPSPADRQIVDPTGAYESHSLQGFSVHVNKRLNDVGADSAKAALKRLDDRLAEVVRLVPVGMRSPLLETGIWVEAKGKVEMRVEDDKFAAFYVPLGARDFEKSGILPEKEGGIEIPAVTWLLEPNGSSVARFYTGWLLHELAHSIHDRILSYDQEGVKTVYRQAMERHLYDAVATRQYKADGNYETRLGPAYARTNHLEYFAELSVAYFGLSRWTYPFTREELKTHDPAGFALMESVWRDEKYTAVNNLPHAVFVYGAAEGRRKTYLFNLDAGEKRTFAAWPAARFSALGTLTGHDLPFMRGDGGAWHSERLGGRRDRARTLDRQGVW